MPDDDCPLSVGQVLDDKYRVDAILGRGGVGVVAKAEHLVLKHPVAIKALQTALSTEPRHAARFLQEARAAVRLKSQHTVRVFDVGTLPSGIPFMVMEYLTGSDLARYLEQRGPLPVADVVQHLLDACDGLAEAHSHGIVHRDIKPANLFLSADNDRPSHVTVLDFGIAKAAPSIVGGDGPATVTGSWVGSPRYMAPEQMKSGGAIDGRTDIWALGVTAYELLAGVPPFPGELLSEICASVLHVEPVPLRELRGDVPPALAEVIMSCLSKEPAGRPTTVDAFARALAPFASSATPRGRDEAGLDPSADTVLCDAGTLSSSQPPPLFGSSTRTESTVDVQETETVPSPEPRRSRRALPAALGLVAVVTAGVWTWKSTAPPPPPLARGLANVSAARVGPKASAPPARPSPSPSVESTPRPAPLRPPVRPAPSPSAASSSVAPIHDPLLLDRE